MSDLQAEKPKRLYFESYLAMIKNAVGTEMFRNFYLQMPDGQKIDSMEDGNVSCAFFVSGLLRMLGRLPMFTGTVKSTKMDLETAGWQKVDSPGPGDVIVWELMLQNSDTPHEHMGFCLDAQTAVSTDWVTRKVQQHDIHFGDKNRKITAAYRCPNWD